MRAGFKSLKSQQKAAEPAKSELEQYLSEEVDEASLDDQFDVLCWWKLKAPKFPKLALLVRDILAIPISTVASESTFSTSGRILSPTRNRLSNESISSLICAQDWLKASVDGKFNSLITYL